MDLARQGLLVALMVTLPLLAVALFIGLAVSVFQALTQVQEATLTFLPKMVCSALVILVLGSWMLTSLVRYTQLCFDYAANVLK
jgi:flagellar biosynthesis protein FliQ